MRDTYDARTVVQVHESKCAELPRSFNFSANKKKTWWSVELLQVKEKEWSRIGMPWHNERKLKNKIKIDNQPTWIYFWTLKTSAK